MKPKPIAQADAEQLKKLAGDLRGMKRKAFEITDLGSARNQLQNMLERGEELFGEDYGDADMNFGAFKSILTGDLEEAEGVVSQQMPDKASLVTRLKHLNDAFTSTIQREWEAFIRWRSCND